MDAIVPAAGQGTRLRPLTAERPKPLVDVGGRPLLAHVFDALVPAAPDCFVVVIGYRGDAIREHFGASYRDVPIEYVRQERRFGLAHAVRQAGDVVDGDCLVCNGDNVFASSLAPLWEAHRARADADGDYAATMLVEDVSVERARDVGVVVTGDATSLDTAARDDAERADLEGADVERTTVDRVVEKPDDPPSTLVSAGAFAFGPRIFDACRAIEPAATGEYELADAITHLVEQGSSVGVHRYDGERVNVNEPADVDRAARLLGE